MPTRVLSNCKICVNTLYLIIQCLNYWILLYAVTFCLSMKKIALTFKHLFPPFVCLFDLILYVPSTIFQLNRDGSSWVEPVLS